MAITPVFCCGFECGVAGAHGASNWVLIGVGAFSTVQAAPGGGVRSLRANPTAASAGATLNTTVVAATNNNVMRVYVYFTSLPNQNTNIATYTYTGAIQVGASFNHADSSVYASVDLGSGPTFGATGVVVTTGTWYAIDIAVNGTNNPWMVDVQVNATACGQKTTAQAAGTNTTVNLRVDGGTTVDMHWDHLVLSHTTGDYPIGPGAVIGFVPNADGTHTATSTHIVKGTAATPVGAAITSATTDAFNWVNARPISGGATDATRLINQQTLLTTEYAEVQFEHATAAPRAVEALVVDQQASTAAGDMHIKLNDNGTESVILDRTNVAGVITDRYTTKQFATMPAGGGAWTLARFNNVRVRFGYSADATPDQYWRGAMIEAEFPVTGGDNFDWLATQNQPSPAQYRPTVVPVP